jgi:Fe-S-cluster-containing dehydrogenase component
MKKWNFIIDIAKCFDCNNCFLSCKDEFDGNDFPPYSVAQPKYGQRWMNIMRQERGQYPLVDVAYRPTPCMHCDDAPCIKASGNGAVYKKDNGVVLIDIRKAKGRKEIVATCPYGAIFWNEERDLPQMCTFCAHLLEEGWEKPRCVQACPTGALSVVHVEDPEMKKIVETENLETLKPELKTRPRVYYKNLYRYSRCFIAGNVVLKDQDVCAEGAKVILSDSSEKVIGKTVTNNYGDFKLDNLEEDSGQYKVVIEYKGYETQTVKVDLKASINIGNIFL